MKQETNSKKSNELDKVNGENSVDLSQSKSSKLGSLLSTIFLMFMSIFVFGIGILWLFKTIGVDDLSGGLIASQAAIAVLALAFFRFKVVDLLRTIKLKVTIKGIVTVLGSVFLILSMNVIVGTLINLLNLTPNNLDEYTSTTTEAYVAQGGLLLLFLMPVIVAPIFEELAFRAGLKRYLVDLGSWKPYQYVIISSLLFGLLHWQPGTFTIVPIIITTFMGIIHAIIYLKSKNILVPIASHMLYNFVIMYLASVTI